MEKNTFIKQSFSRYNKQRNAVLKNVRRKQQEKKKRNADDMSTSESQYSTYGGIGSVSNTYNNWSAMASVNYAK